jgi:PilZ domain
MPSATRSPEPETIAETGNWYPQRSGLRYSFVATVEVVDPQSGKQVISQTANLSSYGCHVRTDTPFRPGTIIKVTVRARSKTFRSEGKIIYSIGGEGMGIRFDNIDGNQQIILNEWLTEASLEAQEHKRKSVAATGSGNRKIFYAVSVFVVVAIVAAIVLWLGML